MVWQDILFSIGSIIFSIALIPSIRSKDKPSQWTSLLTGSVLAAYAPTFASLGLLWSAWTVALTSTLWFILFFQVRRGNDRV